MQVLDTHTLTVVMGSTVLSLAILTLYYNISRRTYPGFKECALGFIFFGVGFLLIGFRNILSDFLTIVVANIFIYLSLILLYFGFSFFAAKKINLYLHIGIFILLAFILHPFFTYVMPNVNVRISISSLSFGIYFFCYALILVKDMKYDIFRLDKMLTATAILLSLFCLCRGILLLIAENTTSLYIPVNIQGGHVVSGVFDGLLFFICIILSIFFIVGVMQLNSQMLENELYHEKAQLKEIENRYKHLADKLKEKMIFFSHTFDGELLYVSEGFDLLGTCSPDDAVGLKWVDIVDWLPDSISSGFTHIQNIINNTDDTQIDMSYRHSDGTIHHIIVYEFSVYNHKRDERIIEGVAVDVTEQKRKEEDMRVLMRAIENTPNSVVITDTDGTIDYVNPSFTRTTGYTREEAIGNNPRVLKSGLHADSFYEKMWNTLKSGDTWRGEISNKRKDGSIYWELASISPIQDERGNTTNYVAVKDDITDTKELERLKQDVERIMRHDLKTPLNAIIGFPQILQMSTNLPEDELQIVKMIESAGYTMLEMIDNSLDMFKMESGTYNYNPKQVEVISVILRVIGQNRSRITGKDLVCKVRLNGNLLLKDNGSGENNSIQPLQGMSSSSFIDQTLMVCSEERLLYSLLSNLFINAIEASPDSEEIKIELADQDKLINVVHNTNIADSKDVNNRGVAKKISIVINNKGAVPKAVREDFFEKYKTYGKSSGTGLGTYSAKLLADAMHYSIRMETSDENNDTTITIDIPKELI